MTDPIYVFKPGEGWLPQNNIMETRCGTRVCAELREPNAGEYYHCIRKTQSTNGESLENYLFSLVTARGFPWGNFRSPHDTNSIAYHYITLVEVK